MSINSKEAAKLTYQALSEKKAEDIQIIDISGISVMADYFVIANGSNQNQIQAMCDAVSEALSILDVIKVSRSNMALDLWRQPLRYNSMRLIGGSTMVGHSTASSFDLLV